jgi:hypothetical protein
VETAWKSRGYRMEISRMLQIWMQQAGCCLGGVVHLDAGDAGQALVEPRAAAQADDVAGLVGLLLTTTA